jgi:prepilin-type N-terminal cleavage/methylation domain-containing protein
MSKIHTNSRNTLSLKAFSLVELSIVLVIIGLLISGVTVGNRLVKAAQLRAVSREVNEFRTAINVFQDAYDALPGDMTNAQDYWATASQAGGNGNGQMTYEIPTGTTEVESLTSWQHLALAETISGNYCGTGVTTGTTTCATTTLEANIGTNVPASKFTPGGYYIHYFDALGADSTAGEKNYLVLGGFFTAGANFGSILTPTDARTVDSKMDDGIPSTGSIIGALGGTHAAVTTVATACTTNNAAAYLLNGTAIACTLSFVIQQ